MKLVRSVLDKVGSVVNTIGRLLANLFNALPLSDECKLSILSCLGRPVGEALSSPQNPLSLMETEAIALLSWWDQVASNMTKSRTMRYWAIGFKGWVEVRSASTPPRAINSIMEYEVENGRDYTFDPVTGNWIRVPPGKVKREIKTTAYDGGRVVKVITTNKFYKLTRKHVNIGSMIELTAAQMALVKASRGYGYDRR